MSLLDDGLTALTDAHMKAIRLLERRGVELMDEVPFPPYCVDIYVPDFHVAIEVDGPQHSTRKDEQRDRDLWEDYALPVLRIKLHEINRMWDEVSLFLATWSTDADERWESVEDKVPWL